MMPGEIVDINTPEELEKLPEKTVILDADGDAMQSEIDALWELGEQVGDPQPWKFWWWFADGTEHPIASSGVAFPARVLALGPTRKPREPVKWEPMGYLTEDLKEKK